MEVEYLSFAESIKGDEEMRSRWHNAETRKNEWVKWFLGQRLSGEVARRTKNSVIDETRSNRK